MNVVNLTKRKKAFAAELFIRETPTQQLQTIGQGSKALICILFTKLDIHRLLLKCKQMLQSDSTNSVIDVTFQETRSRFTRRHTTRMPHQ
ncbi:hypothetical protein CSKR_109761 [Clonorchis sinensis]|uniref:Uncharacterized protein n=1 Tax=Clonorchis sinensis TaxID=79923 RepID=A0A419QDE4_CLOSI|nr:hypothetical protein CSKR_109761 [Clonorchis sinensis]